MEPSGARLEGYFLPKAYKDTFSVKDLTSLRMGVHTDAFLNGRLGLAPPPLPQSRVLPPEFLDMKKLDPLYTSKGFELKEEDIQAFRKRRAPQPAP